MVDFLVIRAVGADLPAKGNMKVNAQLPHVFETPA
jgi:hypothetical protein